MSVELLLDMTGVRVSGLSVSLNRRPRSKSPNVQRSDGSTAIMRESAERVSRGNRRKMLSAAPEVNVVWDEADETLSLRCACGRTSSNAPPLPLSAVVTLSASVEVGEETTGETALGLEIIVPPVPLLLLSSPPRILLPSKVSLSEGECGFEWIECGVM